MRILLDLQGCQSASRLRGIGRYTLSLAKAIARHAGEHEVWLLLNDLFPNTVMPLRREFAGLVPADRIAVFVAQGPVAECDPANSLRARVAELVREHAIAELRPDVVHVGSLFEGWIDDAIASIGFLGSGCPTAVTLYDLIPLLNPGAYLGDASCKESYFRKIESLKQADLLLAISNSAGQEAVRALGLHNDQVVNISSAADERFRPISVSAGDRGKLLQKLGLVRKFLFYIGTIEPRKNFAGVIHAYARLAPELRAAHQLLLVAQGDAEARDGLHRIAASAGLMPADIVLVEHVSDEDLVALFNLCQLFVFPSLHEGFGLPALEAMSCGAPVIGSNTTSIPEVIGRADALFDPSSPASIAETMTRVLADESFSQSLRTYGQERAKYFSWDATAKRALEAFEALHQRRHGGAGAANRSISYHSLISTLAPHALGLTDEDLMGTAAAIAANRSHSGPRQLLVDVSILAESDLGTGIQRVTRSILRQLLEKPPAGFRVEPVRFDAAGSRYKYARAFGRTVPGDARSSGVDDWVEGHRGDIFLGLDLVPDAIPKASSWLAAARRRGIKVTFVVYDLLPLLHPEWWGAGMQPWMETWLRAVCSVSDVLAAISEATAGDIKRWLDGQEFMEGRPLVKHFHLGADFDGPVSTHVVPDDVAAILAKLATAPTFLMVGTLEPRKGYMQALNAFEDLWSEGLHANLVIVGKEGWLVDDLVRRLRSHRLLGQRVFWLEGISDECLEKVYAASTCLIAASEAEGFGLPLVEAAKRKLPIIARDLPVFREVAGTHAFYFSGTSAEALASTVRNWLDLRDQGEEPSTEGMQCFTWAESAAQLMAALLDTDLDAPAAGRRQVGTSFDGERLRHWSGNQRPVALVLSPYPVRRPRHGGQLRTAAMVQAYEATGFTVRSIGFYQSEAYTQADLGARDIAFPVDSPYRFYRGARLPAATDFQMAAFVVEDEETFARIASSIDCEIKVIQSEQPWFVPLARRLEAEVEACKDALIVFSSQNIEAPMKRQILETGGGVAGMDEVVAEIEALEREAAQRSDLCLAVTAEDSEVLRGYGAKNLVLAPNGINPWRATEEYTNEWQAKLPGQPWPLFIASAHPPNFTGFLNVVGDSLACIPPGSRLVVAGGVSPHLADALSQSRWHDINVSRLQILGVLDDDDLSAVKSLAHAFLLPIGGGGGSNIKTAEALYSGKPVICTSMALRGFEDYRNLPEVTIADSPREFQAAIRTVLTSGTRGVPGPATRDLRQRLTWAACLAAVPAEVSRQLAARTTAI